MFVYYSGERIVAVSKLLVELEGCEVLEVENITDTKDLIRNYLVRNGEVVPKLSKQDIRCSRIALIGVWGIACGIATYTQFLVEAMRKEGLDITVFAERYDGCIDTDKVKHCWSRGKSLEELSSALKGFAPDYIYIQHEYGIFPDARHWTRFVGFLNNYNYSVAFHSVYKHQDKTVCEAPCNNIIVHSSAAKEILLAKGISGKITVIPHGCNDQKDLTRLWNIYKSPHTVMQFGFGFEYKGWNTALEAVKLLKDKYSDIFYLMLFSESSFSVDHHDSQYHKIEKLIKDNGLEENTAVVRGYQTDEVIDTYLKTIKVAVFPYTSHPEHIVYGASGAARIALANGTPTIVSTLPIFYDLDGVVPRINSAEKLAEELDKLFSNKDYYNSVRDKGLSFVKETNWQSAVSKYLDVFKD